MSIDSNTIIGQAVRAVSFEGLENRQLLAGFTFADNALTVHGSGKSDEIHVSISDDGSQIWARVNGKRSEKYAASNVWAINVRALDGHNLVWIDPRITAMAIVHAGKGDDTIITGSGNDAVYSGAGNDVISTGAGNDVIDAGEGHDRINAGDGNDMINGGSGNDIINAGSGRNTIYAMNGKDKVYAETGDTVDLGGGRSTLTYHGVSGANLKPNIKRLKLVNADTGATVSGYESLWNGMTLDLSNLPANLTVVADLDRAAESVRFVASDGSANRVESGNVFAMTAPSSNGKLAAWSPSLGSVKLNATPYSGDNATGTVGETFSVTLNLVRSSSQQNGNGSNTVDPAAPTIRMNALESTVIAGHSFHIQATQTAIPGYQVEDAQFAWDFGDASGRYNTMNGFNGAHVYNTPGTYTVKLTVTAPGGKVSVATTKVNVVANNQRAIYVSSTSGDDSADGRYDNRAVRTLARAFQIAGENAMILLKRGDTFTVTTSTQLNHNNTVITAYGSGSNPTILWTGARAGAAGIFTIPNSTQNVAIRGITFNTVFSTDTEQTGVPHAIVNGGRNVTVEGNTFLNVGYAINNNWGPTGLHALDNKAPLETGIRGYFSWTQGTDIVIVGNEVANSTREHIVRISGAERINVSSNKFTNLTRVAQGDSRDTDKGTVVVQRGAYAYVSGNQLRGPAGVGPLGGADGLNQKWGRFQHAAFENNTMFGGTFFFNHGAEHVTARDNLFYKDNGIAIVVQAYDAVYGRGVIDAVIDHNVAVNTGTQGNFLKVEGDADGIDLTNNIYIAAMLSPGSYATAAVFINDNDLSSFRRITGNVWPAAGKGSSFARGGMVFLGLNYTTENHRTPSEWNNLNKVGDDLFQDVQLDGAFTRTRSMLRAA